MSKFRETQNFDKIILIFAKFEGNFAKTELKILWKFCKITQNEISQQPYAGVEWGGGEVGQYSPGVSAALAQIVPYSASLYTVFHSVFYNSVGKLTTPAQSRRSAVYGLLVIRSRCNFQQV